MDMVLVDVTNLWPSGRCSTASFNTSFTSTTPSCKSESGEQLTQKVKVKKLIIEREKKSQSKEWGEKRPLPKLIPLISDSQPLHDRMRNLSFSLFLITIFFCQPRLYHHFCHLHCLLYLFQTFFAVALPQRLDFALKQGIGDLDIYIYHFWDKENTLVDKKQVSHRHGGAAWARLLF